MIGDLMQHTTTIRPTQASSARSASYVGQVRRFGVHGILYEVIAAASADDVKIRIISTGEITTYPIADVLSDPED
jgi:Family of unknown function (DUF5397)